MYMTKSDYRLPWSNYWSDLDQFQLEPIRVGKFSNDHWPLQSVASWDICLEQAAKQIKKQTNKQMEKWPQSKNWLHFRLHFSSVHDLPRSFSCLRSSNEFQSSWYCKTNLLSQSISDRITPTKQDEPPLIVYTVRNIGTRIVREVCKFL